MEGLFDPAPGSVADSVRYAARVEADADKAAIRELIAHTDTVAEVQNTLRAATEVTLID